MPYQKLTEANGSFSSDFRSRAIPTPGRNAAFLCVECKSGPVSAVPETWLAPTKPEVVSYPVWRSLIRSAARMAGHGGRAHQQTKPGEVLCCSVLEQLGGGHNGEEELEHQLRAGVSCWSRRLPEHCNSRDHRQCIRSSYIPKGYGQRRWRGSPFPSCFVFAFRSGASSSSWWKPT